MSKGTLFSLVLLAAPLFGAAAVAAPTAPNSKCAECHDVQAKLSKSAHAAVACTSCHVRHEDYPHPENQPKPACANCHLGEVQNFWQSVHGAELKKGNSACLLYTSRCV